MSAGPGDLDAAYTALRWKHLRTVESMQTVLERNVELEKIIAALTAEQVTSEIQHKKLVRSFAKASERTITLFRKDMDEARRAAARIATQDHAKTAESVESLAEISRRLLERSLGLETELLDARSLIGKLENDLANGVGMEGHISSLNAELEAERLLRSSLQSTIDQMDNQSNDAAQKLKILTEKFQRKIAQMEEAHNEEVSDLKKAYLNERYVFSSETDHLKQIIEERENHIKYLLAEMDKLKSYQLSGPQFAKFVELKNQNANLQSQVTELSKQLQSKDKKGSNRRNRNSDDGGNAPTHASASSSMQGGGQMPRLQQQQQQASTGGHRERNASGPAPTFRSASVSHSMEGGDGRFVEREIFPSRPAGVAPGGSTGGLSDAPAIVARVGDIYNIMNEERYSQPSARKKVFDPSISPVVSMDKLAGLTSSAAESAGGDPGGAMPRRPSRRNVLLKISDSESDFAIQDAFEGGGGDGAVASSGPHPPLLPLQQISSVGAVAARGVNNSGPVKLSPRGGSNAARQGVEIAVSQHSPRSRAAAADAPARHISPLVATIPAATSPRLQFS